MTIIIIMSVYKMPLYTFTQAILHTPPKTHTYKHCWNHVMRVTLKISAIVLTLLLSGVCYGQTRDFSNAHKKIERALEGSAEFPGSDAIWVKHDTLLIAVAKNTINEKKYAEQVCDSLKAYGFGSQNVQLIIVDQDELRSRNQWSQLAERQCK